MPNARDDEPIFHPLDDAPPPRPSSDSGGTARVLLVICIAVMVAFPLLAYFFSHHR